MSNWDALSEIITPPQTLTPTNGDSQAQLLHALISALEVRLSASQASKHSSLHSNFSNDTKQAIDAVSELQRHFAKLVDNNNLDALKNALKGHHKDEVSWMSPEAQVAYANFIPKLAALIGKDVPEEAAWYTGLEVDEKLLNAGVECAESALKEAEQLLRQKVQAREEIKTILEDERERARQGVS